MILFKKDWASYPTAIVDVKTKNTSFLKLARTYQRMGIENHTFMLALHNPQLQGVDPHSPNLTERQMEMIQIEARTNIWYHLREIVRFSSQGGDLIPFAANRGNIAAIWCFLNHITAILIQPRQTFKSGSTEALTNWLLDVGGFSLRAFLFTKDSGLQIQTIQRIKSLRNNLPPYLYQPHPKDMDNKTGLNNFKMSTEYVTQVKPSNTMAANNVGRGFSSPVIHIDEAPFITFIAKALAALLASSTEARRQAKRSGTPYGTIFTTTAGRKDDRDGSFMYKVVAGAMPISETMFDCRDEADAHDFVAKGCARISTTTGGRIEAVNITMSHRQLGYSDEWLDETIRVTGGEKEEIERDFLNIWNSGSASSPLPTEVNARINMSKRDASFIQNINNYLFHWYVNPDELSYLKKHSKIILGMDSSEASGRDAVAFVAIDVATTAVVGRATIGLANLMDVMEWIFEFMCEHDVLLVPERRSTGQNIIDYLIRMLPQRGIDPFKRIFNWIVNDAHESRKGQDAYYEITSALEMRDDFFYTERKTSFGIATDSEKRKAMYGTILQNAARTTADSIRDDSLIREILSLVKKRDRVDHSALGHDDHVFAWLLCHYVLNEGSNLSHYGIPAGLAMSAVRAMDDDEISNPTLADEMRRTESIRNMEEIDSLVEKLSSTDNVALLSLYEQRIRVLSRKVEATGRVKGFTLDAVMERVREERNKNQKLRSVISETATIDIHRKNFNDVVDKWRSTSFSKMGG